MYNAAPTIIYAKEFDLHTICSDYEYDAVYIKVLIKVDIANKYNYIMINMINFYSILLSSD